MTVTDASGASRTLNIPASGGWTRRELADIPLAAGTATITIRAAGGNGFLFVDDLELVKTSGDDPPPLGQRYEAETAPAVCQGSIDSNHGGFSGSGFCNGDGAVGAYAEFTIDAAAAGAATVDVRFANGHSNGAARPANLIVNGATVGTVSFENTGAWNTWATETLTVPLDAGSNTIRLDPTTAAGLPNVDYLDAPPPAEPERYEAETAPAVCQGSIDSNHGGFSGSGFCNGDGAVGAYAEFTVDAETAGTATVDVRFANGHTSGDVRPANLIVNGATVGTVTFESTGAWSTWSTTTVTVPLDAGNNTIRLDPTLAAGLPNIDYLDLGAAAAARSGR
jgi:hypothetical protein